MASSSVADSSSSGANTNGGGGKRTSKRKRPRSQSSAAVEERGGVKLQEEDFTCPICYNLFEEVYSTVCGHSFCYKCIRQMLLQAPHCPICKAALPSPNPIHPNFSLNDLVAKYKQQKAGSAKRKCNSSEGQKALDMVSSLSEEDLPKVLEVVQERLRQKEERGTALKYHVLEDFLVEAQRSKERELALVQKQLKVIENDLKALKSQREASGVEGEEATRRKMKVHGSFQELLDDYLSRRVPSIEGLEASEAGDEGGEEAVEPYEDFAVTLDQFTKYSTWKEVSSLNYGDQSSACSIVSSIEFDKDGEVFAVGGVTKKIKIYSFSNLLQSSGFHSHFPVCEMTCQAKLSSVFFNPYHKNQLASSDYEGCVCIWDVASSTKLVNHQEHSKRVWSVVYNPSEPTMYASGSDDCTVKLWCNSRPHSIFTIDAKANVCSVRFHPIDRHYLAYGSADHSIHYIDLRNPQQQLFELKGHRKAVSYVQFINNKEVISASTDSELKLWNVERGQVLRTYRGHTNEKNFVGLSVSGDFISCGSEDNAVYVYCKQVSKPMLRYKFNTQSQLVSSETESQLHTAAATASASLHPHQQQQDTAEFVSSVCWKKNSRLILGANSQGHVRLLKMC